MPATSQAHLDKEQAMQREQRAGRVRVHHGWQLDDVLHWSLHRQTLKSKHKDVFGRPEQHRSRMNCICGCRAHLFGPCRLNLSSRLCADA